MAHWNCYSSNSIVGVDDINIFTIRGVDAVVNIVEIWNVSGRIETCDSRNKFGRIVPFFKAESNRSCNVSPGAVTKDVKCA